MRYPGQTLVRLPPNERGRDFYIGDLHGCTGHLDVLLSAVQFDRSADRLISTGDLIDRGPDSWGASALIDEPWFHAVLGNHEVFALACQEVHPFTDWQGLMRYYRSATWQRQLPPDKLTLLIERLNSLPVALEVEQRDGRRFGVIHGEIAFVPGWSLLYDLNRDDLSPSGRFGEWVISNLFLGRLQWTTAQSALERTVGINGKWRWRPRDSGQFQLLSRATLGIDLLLSGHNIVEDFQPLSIGNRLAIDTGAFYDRGQLSMVDPVVWRYWQVGWRKDMKRPKSRVVTRKLPTLTSTGNCLDG